MPGVGMHRARGARVQESGRDVVRAGRGLLNAHDTHGSPGLHQDSHHVHAGGDGEVRSLARVAEPEVCARGA